MVFYLRKNKRILVKVIAALTLSIILYEQFYCDLIDIVTTKLPSRLDELKIYSFGSPNVSSTSRNLIVILTPYVSMRLVPRLQSLDVNLSDNFTTPLLIMCNNLPNQDYLKRLSKSTRRQMMFLDITPIFTLFPPGIDSCRTRTSYWRRGKWNYQQMIRFWFKILFQLPLFYQYDYIMRLDDDSQVLGTWINVFDEMRKKRAVYFANDEDVDLEKSLPGTMKLPYTALKHVLLHNITVKQPDMIRHGFGDDAISSYFNNFEVVKLDFFRRKDVWKWIEEVDRTNGIFKYRWGDAPLRYITLGIFAEAHEVLHRSDYNLSYCHKC